MDAPPPAPPATPSEGLAEVRSGLQVRMGGAMLAFVLIMVAAYYWMVHLPMAEQLVEMEKHRLSLFTASVQAGLEDDLDRAEGEIRTLAENAALRGGDPRAMDPVLVQARRNSAFTKFTVLDTEGRILARPDQRDVVGESRADRDYFRLAMRLAQDRGQPAPVVMTEPMLRRHGASASLSLSFSAVIRDRDDQPFGVLAGHADLLDKAAGMFRLLSRQGTVYQGARVVLLSASGQCLARGKGSLTEADLDRMELRDHPLLVPGRTRGQPETFAHAGRDWVGIVQPVGGHGLQLLAFAAREPLQIRAAALVNRLAWLFGVVFLLIIVVAGLYFSRIVRPLSNLTASLVHFGQVGDARPLHSPKVSGEVGDAITAFNQMISDRSRVEAALLQQRGELRDLARELSRTEQRTRHGVAEDLHDHISQHLAASKIRLEMLRGHQSSPGREANLQVSIDLLMQCLRQTSRLTDRLAQPALKQLGLVNALDSLVAEFDGQHSVDFHFSDDAQEKPVDDSVADALYRGVRELLHNIVKHAKARAAWVRLSRRGATIHIEVRDDGVGFDRESKAAQGTEPGGFGLFSFRERILQLGGVFELDSTPGRGSRVSISVPISAALKGAI